MESVKRNVRKNPVRKLAGLGSLVIGVCGLYLMSNAHMDKPKLFQYILSLRVPTLCVMLLAAFAIGSASIIFQSIINNGVSITKISKKSKRLAAVFPQMFFMALISVLETKLPSKS